MDSEDFPKIVDSSSLTLHFCIVKDLLSGYSQGMVALILLPFRQSVGVVAIPETLSRVTLALLGNVF